MKSLHRLRVSERVREVLRGGVKGLTQRNKGIPQGAKGSRTQKEEQGVNHVMQRKELSSRFAFPRPLFFSRESHVSLRKEGSNHKQHKTGSNDKMIKTDDYIRHHKTNQWIQTFLRILTRRESFLQAILEQGAYYFVSLEDVKRTRDRHLNFNRWWDLIFGSEREKGLGVSTISPIRTSRDKSETDQLVFGDIFMSLEILGIRPRITKMEG